MRGKLIVFEGIDGSGKTTQARRLREHLEKKGVSVVAAREPGGTSLGEEVRRMLLDKERLGMSAMVELFLFSAARAQLCEQVLRPALAEGRTVILDRFWPSTVVYQGALGGVDLEVITSAMRGSTEIDGESFSRPNLLFYLDAHPCTCAKRKSSMAAGLDRIEMRFVAKDHNARHAYEEAMVGAEENGIPLARIDANLDEATVTKNVIEAYERTFGATP